MVVQHNLTAMNSNRMLGITTGAQAKATEKLSSGYRINRAADDAAGLSISEKMRKQIRGLNQASTNAQDGISAVQTAEGALTEVHSMLQRMNELAVQASNGTLTSEDRQAVQDEIDQLVTEVDRVSETTKFNDIYLLKGSETEFDTVTTTVEATELAVEYTKEIKSEIAVVDDTVVMTGTYYKKGDATALDWKGLLEYVEVDDNGDIALKEGAELYNVAAADGQYGAQLEDTLVASIEGDDLDNLLISSNALYLDDGTEVEADKLADYFDDNGAMNTQLYAYDDNGALTKVGAESLAEFVKITPATEESEETKTVAKALSFKLHVGAESDDNNKITVDIDSMSSASIGVDVLKGTGVMTQDDATNAIDIIEAAIMKVSENRSALGAVQNRLEHTIANLDNVAENTTAAESRIRDTDMAEAMVEYSKNNILAQAGQSMLAQANQANQGVLSLLQ